MDSTARSGGSEKRPLALNVVSRPFPQPTPMSAVAAIQTGLDDLAGDVLDEVLLPEHRDFLHPKDLGALQREQRRRGIGA